MPHLLFIIVLNIFSIYLSQSVPGRPLVNAAMFAVFSIAVFLFRDQLGRLVGLPESAQRNVLGLIGAYALSGGYIFIWAFIKVLNVAFPGCSPHC